MIVKHTQYQWWVLAVSTMTQLCAALSTQGIGVLAGFLQHDFSLSNGQIGLIAAVLNTAPILGLLLIGQVLDRFGERMPVFIGMCVIGTAMLLMSTAHYFALLLVALFLAGIGYSPIQPGGSKAIYTWFPPTRRGFAMGIRQAALPLGGAAAAIIFPILISHYNWRIAVDFAGFIIILAGILFFIVYRDINLPSADSILKRTKLSVFKEIITNPSFFRVARIGMILVSIQSIVVIFWMLFLKQRFQVTLFSGAWHFFAMLVFGAIGRICIAALSDKIKDGRRKVTTITMLIIIVLLLFITFLSKNTSPLILIITSCMLGFFTFGWYGSWIVWLSDTAETKNIGAVLGLSLALNQIAIVISPLLFGILLDLCGTYTIPFLCLIIATIWVYYLEKTNQKAIAKY